jgi:hypothetical protein
MAVVNRCAVGNWNYPAQQLLGWVRRLDLDVDAAGAREPCLYLIPDNETEEEAEELLEEVFEAIFEAELDDWHRDTGTWPAERTYAVFRKWCDVRLYSLIQDLMGEDLTATEVDEEFIGERRPAADPAGGAAAVAGLLLLAPQGCGEHG